MSRSVNINLELLGALVKLEKQPKLCLLRIADKSLVTAICECALNILNGNIPITPQQKQQLYHQKGLIRALAKSKSSWKSKRLFIVNQCEKILPLIIQPVLQSLTNNERSKEDGVGFPRNTAKI